MTIPSITDNTDTIMAPEFQLESRGLPPTFKLPTSCHTDYSQARQMHMDWQQRRMLRPLDVGTWHCTTRGISRATPQLDEKKQAA